MVCRTQLSAGNPFSLVTRCRNLLALLAVLSAMICCSCGGSSSAENRPTPFFPYITSQPASQTLRLEQSATFNVAASGTAPFDFQWKKNGRDIPGATAASYTTPELVAEDDGASFTVVVSNSAGSTTSRPAILTLEGRLPAPADLRFKQAGAPSTLNGYVGWQHLDTPSRIEFEYSGYYGTPASVGANCYRAGTPINCRYAFGTFFLPDGVTGLGASYRSNTLDQFRTAVDAEIAKGTVVTALDLQPANDVYVFSTASTTQTSGFDIAEQEIAPSQLQALASLEADRGRVITAVSFNASGNLYVVSYGWSADRNTIYEAKVATATIATLEEEAAGLADEGYFITAVGAGDCLEDGYPSHGFVLVGTRVAGETLRRFFLSERDGPGKLTLLTQGYALVGIVHDPGNYDEVWLGQR